MKKRTIVIIAMSLGLVYLCIRYVPILWFLFFTQRGDGELRPEEIKLFELLKKEYKVTKISREPRYYISNPKDTISYELYIEDIDCNKSPDSIREMADDIAKQVNEKLFLNPKFYKYSLTFYCKKGPPLYIDFNYLRKDLK